jgi:nitrate reductase NapD
MDHPPTDDRALDAATARPQGALDAGVAETDRCPPQSNERLSPEFHVAGIVVYVAPAKLEFVAREIAALAGVQVHAASAEGKLVVTLEAPTAGEVLSRFDEVQRVRGVLSVALVYQHGDRESDDSATGGREGIANERFA